MATYTAPILGYPMHFIDDAKDIDIVAMGVAERIVSYIVDRWEGTRPSELPTEYAERLRERVIRDLQNWLVLATYDMTLDEAMESDNYVDSASLNQLFAAGHELVDMIYNTLLARAWKARYQADKMWKLI